MRLDIVFHAFLVFYLVSGVMAYDHQSTSRQVLRGDLLAKFPFKFFTKYLVRQTKQVPLTNAKDSVVIKNSRVSNVRKYLQRFFQMKANTDTTGLHRKDFGIARLKYQNSARQNIAQLKQEPHSWDSNRLNIDLSANTASSNSTKIKDITQEKMGVNIMEYNPDNAIMNDTNGTTVVPEVIAFATTNTNITADMERQCAPPSPCPYVTTTYVETTTTTTTQAPPTPVINIPILELIAISVAVAVPVAISAYQTQGQPTPINPIPDQIVVLNLSPQTTFNDLNIPVEGTSFSPDNCRNYSVSFNQTRTNLSTFQKRMSLERRLLGKKQKAKISLPGIRLDGPRLQETFPLQQNFSRPENETCQTLLRRCSTNPRLWVTLDPETLQGRCTPRLCGRNRVFVGRDGLCHDIYDSNECTGGRRLYYTAYGDSICDCPLGQYPFPTAQDNCVSLFEQGPCPPGNVVDFVGDGRLQCTPNLCPSRIQNGNRLIPFGENRNCYEFGTVGPCRPNTELLGYDVFERRGICVDILDPLSPYFPSPEEDDLLDNVYNQVSAEYGDYQITLVEQNLLVRKDSAEERQEQNTLGAFQVPGALPEILLNPCRPGAQRELNYKCMNPILPERRRQQGVLPAVRPAYSCPADEFLQATGRCVSNGSSASCGPSQRFNQATGQCRSVF